MSYISSMLSPYRGDLPEEIAEILTEDHKMVCRDVQSRGLIFLIAYIMVMATSVLKVILHSIDHFRKPELPHVKK